LCVIHYTSVWNEAFCMCLIHKTRIWNEAADPRLLGPGILCMFKVFMVVGA
jgi:hypothetical protein